MTRSLGAAALALVLCGSLAGCAPEADEEGRALAPRPSRVDVDTPELRRLKREARIEPCQPGDAVSSSLPEITLPCLGGGPSVDLSTLQGPLVINFWYAACGPCREEMPALQAFYERHGDRVPVLGIDYQDVLPGVALELARDTGARYPQLADPGGELNGLEPFPPTRTMPYLAFVDRRGQVVGNVFGGVDSAEQLVDLVHEHLGIAL